MAADLKVVTRFFLDRAGVAAKVERGRLRVLAKFGAYTRRSARSSIRKRKASAAPGRPPSSHRGDLRRLILFGLDPAAGSVVIGPVIFDQARRQSKMAQEALEYGGEVTRLTPVPVAKSGKRAATRRQAAAYRRLLKERRIVLPPREFRSQTFRYRGNPFMGPAFARELANAKLKPLLADTIR